MSIVNTFMIFYLDNVNMFSMGRETSTGKILLKNNITGVVYEDILEDYDSLSFIFAPLGYMIKQENLDLYDSIDTFEMVSLPLKDLFARMDMNCGYNVDILRLPVLT